MSRSIAKHALGQISRKIGSHILVRTIGKSGFFPRITYRDVYLIWEGLEDEEVPLTILFMGDERNARYFSHAIHSTRPFGLAEIGKQKVSSMEPLAEKMGVDICFVHAERTFQPFLSRQGFLILPKLNFVLDTTRSWDQILRLMSRRRRRDIKSISGLRFSCEISRVEEELAYFYHKMYVPFVHSRHGESTMQRSFETLRDLLKNGGILFVNEDGMHVAGIFYCMDSEKAKMDAICFGIAGSGNEGLRKYSSQITLLRLIELAKKNGIKTLNFGLAPPFFNDGLFRYKKEWGMRAEEASHEQIYAFKMLNLGKNVRRFLGRNPFVMNVLGKLVGAAFINDCDPFDSYGIADFLKGHRVPGIDEIMLFSSREFRNRSMKVLLERFKIGQLSKEECFDMRYPTAFADLLCKGLYLYKAT